jgi:hypothetical protein
VPQIDRSPSPPVEVDLARVVRVGMALWLVGLVVTLVLAIGGTTGWVPFAVCATGLALGVLALLWARRH